MKHGHAGEFGSPMKLQLCPECSKQVAAALDDPNTVVIIEKDRPRYNSDEMVVYLKFVRKVLPGSSEMQDPSKMLVVDWPEGGKRAAHPGGMHKVL